MINCWQNDSCCFILRESRWGGDGQRDREDKATPRLYATHKDASTLIWGTKQNAVRRVWNGGINLSSYQKTQNCRCINNNPPEENVWQTRATVCEPDRGLLWGTKASHSPLLFPLALSLSRLKGHLERIKALRTLDLPWAPDWMGGPL